MPRTVTITITDASGNTFTKLLEGDDLNVWCTALFRLRELYKGEVPPGVEPELQEWADKAGRFINNVWENQ